MHSWKKVVDSPQISSLELMISSLGFMNDANWISSSKEDVEEILAVADEFYIMTKSAINRDNPKILTNKTDYKAIDLRF